MKIAIMGCGTVGMGVFNIIEHSPDVLLRGSRGEALSVKYVLDIKTFEEPEITAKQIRDIDILVNDPEIDLVVETMGGLHPAFEFCMKCLEHGKSVVTSNKLLVSVKGEELFDAAKAHNAAFRFGAAVCGGMPVLRTLFYGMAANELKGFTGILNGTSNFVLTKMFRDRMVYADALRLAQERGYAEKDPTDDIEGFDAARKTAILCSVCFGRHFTPDEIHTEGISAVTKADAAYVSGMQCKIKLLGFGKRLPDGSVAAGVSPAVISCGDQIAGADGVMNAVRLSGSNVGDLTLFGAGAGREATASAVVADILNTVRCPGFDAAYYWGKGENTGVSYLEKETLRFYVRGCAEDKNAAKAAIESALGEVTFLTRENAPENELAFVTEKAPFPALSAKIDGIEGLDVGVKIRVYEK